jgi:osmotically-inducible protein OsmY
LATRFPPLWSETHISPAGPCAFETQQGRVVLKGMVRSYFQKQMAQEAIRRLDGVQEIQNELQVCSA